MPLLRSVWGSLCLAAVLMGLGGHAIEAQAAEAGSLPSSNYRPRYGDLNGDGRTDVLMVAVRKIILIDYDIPIPVPLPTPHPTFLLLSTGSGGYVVMTSISSEALSSPIWQDGGYEVVFGDILGEGHGSVILRSTIAGGPSFSLVVHGTSGAPELVQVLSPETLGLAIAGPNVSVQLQDNNGDGRDDLIVLVDGQTQWIYVAGLDGRFILNDTQSLRAAWEGLKSSIASGDAERALAYIAEGSRPLYGRALSDMGAAVMQLPARWSDIQPVSQVGDYSIWSASVAHPDGERTHVIIFLKHEGQWFIEAF